MKTILYLLLLINLNIFSQEAKEPAKLPPRGQDYIANLDKMFELEDGHYRGTLSIKKGSHISHSWKINFFRRGKDTLLTFESAAGLLVGKYLSLNRGEKIYYYNHLSGRVNVIEEDERLENILHTSFSYLDFAYIHFEADYVPKLTQETKSGEKEFTRLLILPIHTPAYKHIHLYLDKESKQPKKLDYFIHLRTPEKYQKPSVIYTQKEDPKTKQFKKMEDYASIANPEYPERGILIKTLRFYDGKIKVIKEKSKSEKTITNRFAMIDSDTSYISILELKEHLKNTNVDTIFYEVKSLHER